MHTALLHCKAVYAERLVYREIDWLAKSADSFVSMLLLLETR